MLAITVLVVYASLLILVTAIDVALYGLPFFTALYTIFEVKLGIGKHYVLVATTSGLLAALVSDYRSRKTKRGKGPKP